MNNKIKICHLYQAVKSVYYTLQTFYASYCAQKIIRFISSFLSYYLTIAHIFIYGYKKAIELKSSECYQHF